MKTILTIDCNILMSPSLPFYQNHIGEFVSIGELLDPYSLLRFAPANLNVYEKLTNEVILPLLMQLPVEKIHFVYGQEDTIHFLDPNEENYLINIDYHGDTEPYDNVLNNTNWISYAFDKGLISQCIWLNDIDSNLEETNGYPIDTSIGIENAILELLPFPDEVIISISDEWILPQYKPLITLWINMIQTLTGKPIEYEEYQEERVIK